MDPCGFRQLPTNTNYLAKVIQQFLCNIKQDTYHCIADQITYWGLIRPSVLLFNFQDYMGPFEFWLFLHGWLILLLWRAMNAALDTIKRLRDMEKPEWETNIEPLIQAELKRDRRLTFWQKVWKFLRELFTI
jgi:hypothetical protein